MNENTTEKVAYQSPVVLDHGSIADHTFGHGRRRRRCRRDCGPTAPPGLSSTF